MKVRWLAMSLGVLLNETFADGAAREGQRWQGGKVDDATVVVALVSEEVHNPTLEVPII